MTCGARNSSMRCEWSRLVTPTTLAHHLSLNLLLLELTFCRGGLSTAAQHCAHQGKTSDCYDNHNSPARSDDVVQVETKE